MAAYKHSEQFTVVRIPDDYDFYEDDSMYEWCEEHAGDRSYSWGYDDKQGIIWFAESIVANLFKLTFGI